MFPNSKDEYQTWKQAYWKQIYQRIIKLHTILYNITHATPPATSKGQCAKMMYKFCRTPFNRCISYIKDLLFMHLVHLHILCAINFGDTKINTSITDPTCHMIALIIPESILAINGHIPVHTSQTLIPPPQHGTDLFNHSYSSSDKVSVNKFKRFKALR